MNLVNITVEAGEMERIPGHIVKNSLYLQEMLCKVSYVCY